MSDALAHCEGTKQCVMETGDFSAPLPKALGHTACKASDFWILYRQAKREIFDVNAAGSETEGAGAIVGRCRLTRR